MQPQLGLSGRCWPIHPHRLDDELLSSWLLRTAHSNGVKFHSFVSETLGTGSQVITRDIDRLATTATLELLSSRTGSSVADLRKGLISDIAGSVVDQHTPNGNCRWVLPLGIYHRTRRRFGLQFCPTCLTLDTSPYFRRRWRLAFNTVCDWHGCLLHDRCPACLAPVVPARTEVGRRRGYKLGAHTLCHQCGFDLRRSACLDPPGVDGKGILLLRSLSTFYDLGWWFVDAEVLPCSISYYDGLRHLLQFLTTRRGRRLLERIWASTPNSAHQPLFPISAVPFEQKPLLERHYLLTSAIWLLDDWPRRFIENCREARVTASWILLGKSLPYWLEDPVREFLMVSASTITEEEAQSAVAYLERTNERITSKAVSRLMGKSDVKACKPYSSYQPSLTTYERVQLIAAIEGSVSTDRQNSLVYARAKRDIIILDLLERTTMGISKLLECRLDDADEIVNATRESGNMETTRRLLDDYVKEVRATLNHDKTATAYLFLGVTGVRLSYKNWNQYLRKLKREYLHR